MPLISVPGYEPVLLPSGITSLNAYRKWIHTRPLPEKLRAHFLRGEVWVDFHMEEAFSHNFVKAALIRGLGPVCDAKGLLFCDGMLLTNDVAEIGTSPDAMFVSNESLAKKRVEFTAGDELDAVATEVVGTPDLVIEIISRTTIDKDTEWLMSAYHNAGIPEYWLIDARDEDDIQFDIHKRTPKEYAPGRKSGVWVKSQVLGKSFRLMRRELPNGYPQFKLEVR